MFSLSDITIDGETPAGWQARLYVENATVRSEVDEQWKMEVHTGIPFNLSNNGTSSNASNNKELFGVSTDDDEGIFQALLPASEATR